MADLLRKTTQTYKDINGPKKNTTIARLPTKTLPITSGNYQTLHTEAHGYCAVGTLYMVKNMYTLRTMTDQNFFTILSISEGGIRSRSARQTSGQEEEGRKTPGLPRLYSDAPWA